MRKRVALPVIGSLLLSAVAVVGGAGPASGAPTAPAQAVTATSIRVGIPYVDLAAVRQFGITLDQGSFPDAYNAIIANLNAHGGINGRHIVPYLVAVNPVGTGPAVTACTQLAEDDDVFVAIAPQQSDCFLQQHHVPTISGTFEDAGPTNGTPNFTLLPPAAAYDPLQLAVLDHRGVFKNKKVGLFAGVESDGSEMKVVQASLQVARCARGAERGRRRSAERRGGDEPASRAHRPTLPGCGGQRGDCGGDRGHRVARVTAGEREHLPAVLDRHRRVRPGERGAGVLHPTEVSRECPHDEPRSVELHPLAHSGGAGV